MSETARELPKFLFRGDADKANQRLLKSTFRSGQLQTNLISGGYGKQIFEQPLVEFVNKHVSIGWNESHFLSFSESKLTAIRYGLHLGFDVDPNIEDNIYDDEETWDFVFFTLDLAQLTILKHNNGVYEGRYPPTLTKFQNHSFVSILLIDVHTVLINDIRAHTYEQAIANAQRDREWLIFPTTPVFLDPGIVEYSAIMDGGCVDIRTLRT